MRHGTTVAALAFFSIASLGLCSGAARAGGDLSKVQHLVYIMQENRSYDNFLGVLAYAPGSPYHSCAGGGKLTDHRCVDGLTCTVDSSDNYNCKNSNPDEQGNPVHAYHNPRLCDVSGLDHGWVQSHYEANWEHPSDTFFSSPNDGFVLQNDTDNGPEQPLVRDTMGFYNQDDLPVWYGLAETFAMDDRYHASVIGPTLPNRLYYMSATSFGHTTTGEFLPPIPAGYRPITGTLLDLMDRRGVTWTDYYSDLPSSFYLRPFFSSHTVPVSAPSPQESFFSDVAAGNLPEVAYVEPNFGDFVGCDETDGAPPNDVRKDDYFVWQVVNAIRNSSLWSGTVIIITRDEHGGTYDHVAPPHVRQDGQPNPDGIDPGQCEDLSNPPASEQPAGGANCLQSASDAAATCADFTPTGKYPKDCPNFDQYGFRVPIIAVSPFSKPHYVSHTLGDHTSLVALIEERFMTPRARGPHPALTLRDAKAKPLLDMFDFDHSPSLNATIPTGIPPDPSKDNGCSC